MRQFRLHTKPWTPRAADVVHGATLEVLEKTGVEVQHEDALVAPERPPGPRRGHHACACPPASSTTCWPLCCAASPSRRAMTSGDRPTPDPFTTALAPTASSCSGRGQRDRRDGTLADVEEMAALQEKLPNIDFVLSMVHPHELPAYLAPVAQFAAMLRGTSKPLIMVPEDAGHLALFNEMAATCGGSGSWGIYAMPTPPLTHGRESVDRLPDARGSASPWSTPARICPAPRRRRPPRPACSARQCGGAQRPRHQRAREPGSSLRLRHLTGMDGTAHRSHRVLRSGGDGGTAGLGRPRRPLRAALVRDRRLLGLPPAGRAVGARGRHDAAHRGVFGRHAPARPRVRRLGHGLVV